MFDDVLMPNDYHFSDWNYTAAECIEQLGQLQSSVNVDLRFLEEWTALSLETQSVAYYKNDCETVAMLIEAIAAAVLSIESTRISELRHHSFLLHNGLRALLSQTQQHPKPNDLIQLYRLLSVLPEIETFDIHIMFHCFYGFDNVLRKWQENFDYYAKNNGWSDYNALQLNIGRLLLEGGMDKSHPSIVQLDENFKRYLLSISDEPLAAEWFPWFTWFVRSKL